MSKLSSDLADLTRRNILSFYSKLIAILAVFTYPKYYETIVNGSIYSVAIR